MKIVSKSIDMANKVRYLVDTEDSIVMLKFNCEVDSGVLLEEAKKFCLFTPFQNKELLVSDLMEVEDKIKTYLDLIESYKDNIENDAIDYIFSQVEREIALKNIEEYRSQKDSLLLKIKDIDDKIKDISERVIE